MSSFALGNPGMMAQMSRANPDFNMPVGNWSAWWGADTVDPWDDAVLWPQSSLQGGGYFEAGRWAPPPRQYGGQSMLKFIGNTRDSAGALLGTVVVQGFITASDQFLREMVSDAGGYFELCSEYAGTQHYLVAYKAGSPDVAGTSINTLTPS